MAKTIDPVCGMTVDPADSPSFRFEEQTYYLCCDYCQKIFSEQPKKRKVKRKLIRKASDFANKEKEQPWKEFFSENQ